MESDAKVGGSNGRALTTINSVACTVVRGIYETHPGSVMKCRDDLAEKQDTRYQTFSFGWLVQALEVELREFSGDFYF